MDYKFPSDKLVARSMTLHPWTSWNSLHLMRKFHKAREVFEEIAYCSSNDAHVQERDLSFGLELCTSLQH